MEDSVSRLFSQPLKACSVTNHRFFSRLLKPRPFENSSESQVALGRTPVVVARMLEFFTRYTEATAFQISAEIEGFPQPAKRCLDRRFAIFRRLLGRKIPVSCA